MPDPAPKRRWLTFSLRTFLVVTLGVALVLGYIGRLRLAAERERRMQELIARSFSNSAWVERPRVVGKPTAQDASTRKSLMEVLEQKQDPEFRRDYRISVPEHGTGLPRNYDVLVYGKYLDTVARRLELRVRSDKMWAEFATDKEIRRGTLPVEVADKMIRELVYAFTAETKARNPNNWDLELFLSTFSAHMSHAPEIRVEVKSCVEKRPFHLQTEAWQAIAIDVSSSTAGVHGWAHTRVCQGLTDLLREKLPVIPPDDALRSEVVSRLRAITDRGFEDESQIADPNTKLLTSIERDDLAAVEANIFSQLAIAWRIKEAAPELRRLYLPEAEAKLAIVTADDPTELLRAALTGEDWKLFDFALDYVVDNLTSEFADLMVWSWPHVWKDYRQKHIVAKLKRATFNAERTRQSNAVAYKDLLKQFMTDEEWSAFRDLVRPRLTEQSKLE